MRTAPSITISRKDGERGFALLLVFLMAAAVALLLYQQMPRVAFESEREKEQLLQDRGHEYVRGIQLYYIAFKKYPSKIEDLENTNNKRFLRRRYIDPMTGKDEWRLIHVNGAGQLIDSAVQKPPASPTANGQDPNNPSAGPGTGTAPGSANGTGFNTGTGTGTSTGTTPSTTPGTGTDGSPPEVTAAVLRRPSDRIVVPPSAGFTPPGVDPNDPRYWPPATTWTPNQAANGQPGTGQSQGQQFQGQQFQGQPGSGQQNGAQPYPGQQFPGQQYPGQTGALPGGFQPGLPGQLPFQPGTNQFQQGTNQFQNGANQFPQGNNQNNNLNQGFGIQNGGVQGGVSPGGAFGQSPQGNPQMGTIGSVPGGFPGSGSTSAGPGSNNALGMIQNLLTTPQTQAGNMTAIGAGGLAGVASTYKAPSIKIYKDRQKYNEWEFIFDLKTAMPGQGQQGTLPGLGQGAPNGQNQNGQPGQNGATPNGGTNGGSNGIFGIGGATSPTSSTSPTTIH